MLHSRRVFVTGIGLSPVTKAIKTPPPHHESTSTKLKTMFQPAISAALQDAKLVPKQISALFVGNMLASQLQRQSQLASYVADETGIEFAETFSIDAACGSGGAALRLGVLTLLNGQHDHILVVGLEQMDADVHRPPTLTSALAQASHWEQEGSKGVSFVDLNDMLTHSYLTRHRHVSPDDFFVFSSNAHTNALTASHSLLKKPITLQDYQSSKQLTPNIRLLDACPTGNGCAALVLSKHGVLGQDPCILGSSSCTDRLSLHARQAVSGPQDLLKLEAVSQSVKMAYQGAEITSKDVNVFEAHDAYSIMAALSLEASGFCEPGQAPAFARDAGIGLRGRLPMSTFGGLKARGHAVGSSGVYQAVEIVQQLKERAGKNQVPHARIGLTSSFGGAATSVYTHVIGM